MHCWYLIKSVAQIYLDIPNAVCLGILTRILNRDKVLVGHVNRARSAHMSGNKPNSAVDAAKIENHISGLDLHRLDEKSRARVNLEWTKKPPSGLKSIVGSAKRLSKAHRARYGKTGRNFHKF